MQELIEVAREAADAGSEELLKRFTKPAAGLTAKAAPGDFASDADRESEKAISQVIMSALPHDGVLSEESGVMAAGERMWIIDPLDGTSNYLRGLDQWAISIAAKTGDTLECGLIRHPLSGDEWSASEGEVLKNGQPLERRQSLAEGLENAMVGIRVKTPPSSSRSAQMEKAIDKLGAPRYFGSAALHCAWLAEGKMDLVYYEYAKVEEWDVAAGIALCRAAGLEAIWLDPYEPGLPQRFLAGPGLLLEEFLSLTEN